VPALKAQTDDGQELHVHIPQTLAWVLGLCGTGVVAAVALILQLNVRVAAIEKVHVEEDIAGGFVPRAEYESRWSTVDARLDRMEDKIDRLLQGR